LIKLTLLFILSFNILYALDKDSTLKIYLDIFKSLSPNKTIHSIYSRDSEYLNVFKYSSKIYIVNNIKNADIILITNNSNINYILKSKNKKSILFTTNYHILKNIEQIVGAFYWRKGRSQLLFIKKRLENCNIRLPSKYQDYMVDEL